MTGYSRQSVADILNGLDITAPPLNAEFNQMEAAFDATDGHGHTGGTADGPRISLSLAVSGYLPAEHGGVGGRNNISANSAPTVSDDASAGYAPGSIWLDTTTGKIYTCFGNFVGAANWGEQAHLVGGMYTGNTTASSGLSTFNDVRITGKIDANLSMGTYSILNLANPVNATDAVNKQYVTGIIGTIEAAATSATNAANSATASANSATASANSATNAAASVTAAANILDNFDDRYLGTKPTAPSLDNDGNTLLQGAVYFDTTINELRVRNAGAWASIFPQRQTSSVDAGIGRVLVIGDQGSFGLGSSNGAPTLADPNSFGTPSGDYFVSGIALPSYYGLPLVGGHLRMMRSSSDRHYQELRLSASHLVFARTSTTAGGQQWLGWERITGHSIINANGTVLQFGRGLQICTADIVVSRTTEATGPLFRTPIYTWTLPASFVGTPVIVGNTDVPSMWVSADYEPNNTARVYAYNVATGITLSRFHLMAYGYYI